MQGGTRGYQKSPRMNIITLTAHWRWVQDTITCWLSIVTGSCNQVHRDDASWHLYRTTVLNTINLTLIYRTGVLNPWRERELVWQGYSTLEGKVCSECRNKKLKSILVTSSLTHISAAFQARAITARTRASWKASGIRHQVSSIRYQVSGIGYQV